MRNVLSVSRSILIVISLMVTGLSGKSMDEFNDRQTQYAFDLLDRILQDGSGENVFISPLSISLALAMTYNGAEAETKKAMAEALHLEKLSLESVNDHFSSLRRQLGAADSLVKLNIANSIWYREGIDFKDTFFVTTEEKYAAEIHPLSTVEAVNGWVSEKTKNKIKSIIDRINPQDIMLLINAIYFKGNWTSKFEPDLTREHDFTLLDGTVKRHPLMSQAGEFHYFENELFQAISLPYGNRQLRMLVFLPSESTGLRGFLNELDAERFTEWCRYLRPAKGDILLPKFKMEYETKLNDILADMGMAVAFNPERADFTGMYDKSGEANVFISEVLHKTFVEVNEEGTEAAAVTSVRMALTSARETGPERFRMVVDRPFFCAIQDRTSGNIIFMGVITDPE